MSDLLGLAASGIRSYSRALQTVGDNIANAQTTGFARRRTDMAEAVGGGTSVLYPNQVAPGGVRVEGVSRAVDPWLIDDSRESAADAAQSQARLAAMTAAEAAIDDGGSGVGPAMTALFNRADELASDPSSTVRRSAFLQSADDVAASFRRVADGLSRAADGAVTSAASLTDQLNSDLTALASVNAGLRGARDGTTNQATLLDQRDRMIDSIATTIPVEATYDARGAVTLTGNGTTLLSMTSRASFAVVATSDGRLAISAAVDGQTTGFAAQSGALAGTVEAAAGIASQRAAIDGIARDFVTAVNAQHAAGRTSSGANGGPLLAIGSGAGDVEALALSPADVAPANASIANANALAFGSLRGSSDGEARWENFAAQQSQSLASVRAQHETATIRSNGAAEARNTVSSVDLDREAADLVRYQQAYQASARVLQVARENLQSILNAL